MSAFLAIPHGIMNHIKTMLTYKDRATFLILCKETSRFPIETFTPFRLRILDFPRRSDKTYQLYFNPFDYHATRVSSPIPHSFLGNGFVNIILYDTPTSYYNIRIYTEYDMGKTIVDYLKEYKPRLYHINKITKYIYP
jgi:hypothetical protein